MDITEFYQTFFDEAYELLRDMEQHLLELDPADPDSEQLNAIFRSAHSIKGGAATFGFTQLQNTTHTLENLLDKARHNELKLTSEIIDIFLDTKDVMAEQLDAYKNSLLPDEESFMHICEVLGKVEHITENLIIDTDLEVACGQTNVITPSLSELYSHYIVITLSQLKTNEIDLLANELALFGTLYNTEKKSDSLMVWLGTNSNIDDICGVLCFVVEESQITYQLVDVETCLNYLSSNILPIIVPNDSAAVVESIIKQEINPESKSKAVIAAQPKVAPSKVKSDSNSIRVAVEKVDHLINLVGELVIIQSMLTQHSQQLDHNEYSDLLSSIVQIERNSRALQESVMSIRMMPMDYVFSRFPRMVRDIATKLHKKIELKVEGSATELDKSLIERIIDPLNHLVRNSLDHGIEKPEIRLANGKSETGTLILSASHQSGNICIEVRDDGAGLNRERILAKAYSQGLNVHEGMTNEEIGMLIMAPGFSTAEVITDVSGRGVGMDVVKRNIQGMGGRIQIGFTEGKGTIIRILLPLTLAILDGMSVKVSNDIFIVPLSAIVSTLQPRKEDVYRLAGEEKMLLVRGEYLPLVELYQVFSIVGAEDDFTNSIVLVIQHAGHRFALLVDKLVGQQQVVVKNIESNYRKIPGISAATIMGDGSVALILDVAELQKMNNSILLKKKQKIA
ncbi:chemotaxis protein CheA [Providencia burhodogranariea]|uniref:Chemotaxis protein CheA n=1 Tax=Providencia burhodogranariea DSM 19968 TaxID=1141662 RepID=K8WXY4_9GAMM|nr:chemotaxis protein CheA [Providencia burhodogranariea]EKT62257.1 chemotaxis protein CheA [Providencia burhodogranariea DSM 19968]